ncbi:hypothetical protein ALC62_13716 [Cyphomyrmex costatus]|uniref:C2H2-type domain-containing protein n=1 Tax=Cyphomyrmex costatus TaxID=456900 RepID=A0A195C5Z8_9HYME|nr:hypothetical protein ALC62_13716 [Cyphomyrmex costatus]
MEEQKDKGDEAKVQGGGAERGGVWNIHKPPLCEELEWRRDSGRDLLQDSTVCGTSGNVNMVAEPKPHQTGRKRQNVSKTGNDCAARINLPVRGVSFKGPLYPSLKVPTNPKLDSTGITHTFPQIPEGPSDREGNDRAQESSSPAEEGTGIARSPKGWIDLSFSAVHERAEGWWTTKGGLVRTRRDNRNRDAGAIRANIAVVCFRAEFSANVIFEHSSEVENGVRSTCLRANPPSSFPADSISLYYASTAFPPRLAPPLKRPRLMPPTRAQHPKLQKQQSTVNTGTIPDLNQLKVYSNPDILICGNCREMFTELGELLEHKRNYCKLRFTCKCHTFNGAAPRDSTTALLCVLCKLSFPSAWELMVHAQAAHMINIYELGTRAPSPSRSPSLDQPKESSPSPQDFQEIKATDCEERAEEEELDGHELIPSPDSGKSTDNEAALSPIKIRSDVNGLDHEDCDELIHVENTTQACIMHTLSIDSSLELNSDTNSRTTSGTVMALTNGSLSAKE